jgi:hypothetical protein
MRIPSQTRQGAPSPDRSWRSQIADGDAGRTGIRQHSVVLFHVMGCYGHIGIARHRSMSCRGVWVMSKVVRDGTTPYGARASIA